MEKVNNNRAVAYARFSSDAQTYQSIEGQLHEIERYAQAHNIPIIDTYIDEAKTGTNDARPAFQKMIQDAKNKNFGYVLVYRFDRFSRDRFNSLMYKRKLRDLGVKVISVTEYISDDPQGILYESMIDGYAEYYSAELSQKVKRGNRESRMKGLYSGGQVIYGYTIVEKKYTIIPEEAEIIKKIFADAAQGKTYNDICNDLNKRGIRHHDKSFTVSYLHRLVHNRKYIGIVETDGVVYNNIVPPIIDEDTFRKAAITSVTKKKRGSHYRAKDKYLLCGLVYCGYCGERLTSDAGTRASGKVSHYYKCSTRKRKRMACELQTFRKEYLEDLVVQKIKVAILESKALEKIADYICKSYNQTVPSNNLLKLNEKSLTKVKNEIDNALKAILAGTKSSALSEKLEQLEEEKRVLEQENIKLKIKNNSKITPVQALNFLESMMMLDSKSPAYKEILIQRFVKKVIVYNDKLILELYAIDDGFFNDNNPTNNQSNTASTTLASCPPLYEGVEHLVCSVTICKRG